MDREIEVHIDWDGATRPVGRLWARAKGARLDLSFAYDAAWLGLGGAFRSTPTCPWCAATPIGTEVCSTPSATRRRTAGAAA